MYRALLSLYTNAGLVSVLTVEISLQRHFCTKVPRRQPSIDVFFLPYHGSLLVTDTGYRTDCSHTTAVAAFTTDRHFYHRLRIGCIHTV